MFATTVPNLCGRGDEWSINGAAWDWLGTARALTFDGSDDTVTFDQSLIGGYPCTVIVEFSTTNTTAADRCLFSQSNSTDATHLLGLRLNASHHVEAFVGTNEIAFSRTVNDGQRHVAAFTANSSGTVTVYLDGEVGSTVAGGTFPTLNRSTLGAVRSATTTEYFPGTIGRVLVYSRDQDQVEIQTRIRYFMLGRFDVGYPAELFVGHTVAIGIASETDSSLAFGVERTLAFGIASETASALDVTRQMPLDGTLMRIYSWDMGTTAEFQQASGSGGVVQNAIVHSTSGGYAFRSTADGITNGFVTSGIINSDGTKSTGGYSQPFLRVWARILAFPTGPQTFIHLVQAGPLLKFGVRVNPDGTYSIITTSTTTIIDNGTITLSLNTWYEFKLKAVSGNWEVVISDSLGILETRSGSDALTDTSLSPMFGAGGGASFGDFVFDDGALATGGYPPSGECAFLTPNEGGTYQAWTRGGTDTGLNWDQVDEVPNDGDVTYLLSTLGIGDAETEHVTAMPANRIPNAVQAVVFAKRNAGSPAITVRIRSGSTNSDNSGASGAGVNYAPFLRFLAQDPDTSAAWTNAAVNNLEVGAVEQSSGAATRITMMGIVVHYKMVEDKFIATGLVSEADTSLDFAAHKGTVIGVTQTTDSSTPFTSIIDRAFELGEAEDIPIALALDRTKEMAFTFATETDEALDVIHKAQFIEIALQEEADSALVTMPIREYAFGVVATEDTAQIVEPSRDYAVGLTSETDTGLTAGVLKTRVLGNPIIEIDTAFNMAGDAIKEIGLNLEDDSALLAISVKTVTAGQAEETDTAQLVGSLKELVLGLPTEDDSALAAEHLKTLEVDQPSETNSPQSMVLDYTYPLGLLEETDSPFDVEFTLAVVVFQPLEMDEALTVAPDRQYAAGLASETDSAITIGMPLIKPVELTTETDTTQEFSFTRGVEILFPTETDSSLTIAPDRARTFGLAAETDTGHALGFDLSYVVGQPSELGTAMTIVFSMGLLVGIASEADAAIELGHEKSAAIGQASETDSGQTVVFSRSIEVGIASETGSGQAILADRAYLVGQSIETDTAEHIMGARAFLLNLPQSLDTGLTFTRIKTVIVGLSFEADTAFRFIVIGDQTIGVDFFASSIDAQPSRPLCLLVGRLEHLRFEFKDQLIGGLLSGNPTALEVVNGKPVANGAPGTALTLGEAYRNPKEYTTEYGVPVMINQAVFSHVTVDRGKRDPVVIRVTCATTNANRNVVQDFEIETRE